MHNGRKINSKYFLALLFTPVFFMITLNSPANYMRRDGLEKILTFHIDTLPLPKADTVPKLIDTTIRQQSVSDTTHHDSLQQKIDTLNFKVSKDTLDAPITYSAQDSVVMIIPTKQITLYNKSETKYKDLDLTAYKIQLDQPKQVVTATYSKDTAGQIIGKPKMVQTDNTMESDEIVYNLKTARGITNNTYTQSGEMFVHGEQMKKVSPTEYYALRGRFTTCNLDTPHFAFVTNKMKLINKKMAISGPIHPEFEGVPLPIYIPFGYFPIAQGRHSGFLPPVFNASPQYGLGLEQMGYYKVFSDNFDAVFRTDLYTYGGYNLTITPEYRVRYRYSGRLNFTYKNAKILSSTGNQEFDNIKTFSLNWSHTVDSKARPGTNFSASVNVASTKYNRYVFNSPTANFNNQLSSSITYSKTWGSQYNLTMGLNHNQNNVSRLVTVNFPSLAFTATTIYPFAKKEFTGSQKWYEKLGVGLNTTITGGSSFYDSLFSFNKLVDTFTWNAQHNIPITLALPPLFGGALQIGPGISLQQRWYSRKSTVRWRTDKGLLDTTYEKGFWTAENASFSLNLSTAIFGTFTHFGKNSSILGLRHVIRPTVGLTYTPDLASKDWYSVKVNSSNTLQRLSHFANSGGQPFQEGTFGGLSFALDNNLEMKVRSKKDTSEGGIKKVRLIDGFGFRGSYNFLLDSFKLSKIIGFYLSSTLFNNVNITGSVNVNPYQHDSLGFDINKYAWQGKKFSIGRITTGSLAISTNFKSQPKDPKKAEADKQNALNQIPMTIEEQQSQLDYIRNNPAQFADFNVAWSINLSFSLSFSKQQRPDYSGYNTLFNSTLTWNGDFSLTEKWKLGMNSYLDVGRLQINALSMYLSRDLHCWQMSINITPVGLWRSFSITINPKSAILRDLRINRTRSFGDY